MQHHTSPLPAHLVLSATEARTYLPDTALLPAATIHVQFPCSDHVLHHLRTLASSTRSTRHFDVYYDGPQLTLLANHCWLRCRDQAAIAMRHSVIAGLRADSLKECGVRFYDLDDALATFDHVKQVLAFNQGKTRRRATRALDALDVASVPFARFPFIRYEFDTDYGTIYVDETAISDTCADFYVTGTIQIHDLKDIPNVLAFLAAVELNSGPVRSKVVEWLAVRQRDTYNKLVARGVVRDLPYQSEHYTAPPLAHSLEWFRDYAFMLEYPDLEN